MHLLACLDAVSFLLLRISLPEFVHFPCPPLGSTLPTFVHYLACLCALPCLSLCVTLPVSGHYLACLWTVPCLPLNISLPAIMNSLVYL
jgi:hypothetical protein